MKVVLDSSVMIAAFATRGLCDSILEYCLENHEVFLSNHLILEIQKNLRKKIKLGLDEIEEIVSYFKDNMVLLEPTRLPLDSCRDVNDVPVLGLCVVAEANYLITGDKDLLVLGKFSDTVIVTPRQFSDLIHQNPGLVSKSESN